MSFYEKELRKMFESKRFASEKKFIERSCVGKLNDAMVVKLTLADRGIPGTCTGVEVEIVHRQQGVIDKQYITFDSVWGIQKVKNHPNPIIPYIYNNGADPADWYIFKPSEEQYSNFAKFVADYIMMYK